MQGRGAEGGLGGWGRHPKGQLPRRRGSSRGALALQECEPLRAWTLLSQHCSASPARRQAGRGPVSGSYTWSCLCQGQSFHDSPQGLG